MRHRIFAPCWQFESMKRTGLHKFAVMPHRWVVERTIGWMNNWQGLSKDYDFNSSMGEAKVLLFSIYYLSKRLTLRNQEVKIDHAFDVRLRKLPEKNNQTP